MPDPTESYPRQQGLKPEWAKKDGLFREYRPSPIQDNKD